MKRSSVILLGMAALGIGSFAAFSYVARPSSKTALNARPVAVAQAEHKSDEPASSTKEMTALRAEVIKLSADMSALRERMAQASEDPEAPVASPSEDPRPARRDPAEIARRKRERHAHMMEVDSGFKSEAVDPQWASSTASAVQSTLNANDAMRGTMLGVECRSQTCRVEIDDDGSGAVSKGLPIFLNRLGGTLPSAQLNYVDNENGHRTIVVYMKRDGDAQSPAAEE